MMLSRRLGCAMDSAAAKVAVASVLSSLCGYVDVICVARYGAFPATQVSERASASDGPHPRRPDRRVDARPAP